MKVFYTLLGLAIFSLAGFSFYYTNIKKEDSSFKAVTNSSQTELIYIYREYGDVSFKNKTASTFTPVGEEKLTIANHATVKTGNGRGYVFFPDNSSITLSSSTEIEIHYEPTKISILQLIGTTYHRITSLANGNKYEIRTPNTLAAIRGTKLAVSYNEKLKKTYVAVTEHQVEVTPTKEDGTVTEAPVMVLEGSVADIQSSTSTNKTGTTTPPTNQKMIIRLADEVKEIKPFIEENKRIDKEYNNTPNEHKQEFLEKIINLQEQKEVDSPLSEKNPEKQTETLNNIFKEPTTETTQTVPEVKEQSKKATIKNNSLTEATASPTTKTLKDLPLDVEEFTQEQENFIDSFYAVYETYFFVDEPTSYCKRLGTTSAKDMIASLLAVSTRAGYTLNKQTELSMLATDLVAACADGTMGDKVTKFKTRFDTTYPY